MDFALTDTQVMLRRMVKDFAEREIEPRALDIDRAGRFPDDLLPKMGALGLLGMAVPAEFGGSNQGFLSCALVIEQLAYSGVGAWWLMGVNNSIGAMIAGFAGDSTKRECLPPMGEGAAYASIQFTEEATGSDPEALITRATPAGSHYVINGKKRFSTFGARDGVAMLFARDETGACTGFIIDKNAPGYTVGKAWETIGGGGVEAVDIHLENIRVSNERLLGKKGEGFDLLLEWASIEKVQQCAANVGVAQAALDEAVKYAKTRTARGKPIATMQGIRWMLAEMRGKIEASRWLAYRAAFLLDQGAPTRREEAALAKVFVIPTTIEVIELARRIHGGYGYTKDFKIERLGRAAVGAVGVATSLEINKSIVGAATVR